MSFDKDQPLTLAMITEKASDLVINPFAKLPIVASKSTELVKLTAKDAAKTAGAELNPALDPEPNPTIITDKEPPNFAQLDLSPFYDNAFLNFLIHLKLAHPHWTAREVAEMGNLKWHFLPCEQRPNFISHIDHQLRKLRPKLDTLANWLDFQMQERYNIHGAPASEGGDSAAKHNITFPP